MVAIQQGDGQPGDVLTGGEAIWRLLTGVAHDSWDAICKHSPHALQSHSQSHSGVDLELKARADSVANWGRGSNGNNNNNNGNHGSNGNGNGNGNGRDTTTSEEPAKTTSTTASTSAKTTSTPAKETKTEEPAKSTPAQDPTTNETSKEAEATPTEASTPAANNDNTQPTSAANNGDNNNNGDDGSSGAQTTDGSGSGSDAAATGGDASPSAGNDNNNDGNASQAAPTPTAGADVAGATNTGSSNPNSAYVEPNGQTTTVHEQASPTSSGGGRALGAAATSGATSPTGSVSSGINSGSLSSAGGGSHAGVIAGVVVALAAFFIIAALLYRFRRTKALRPLFTSCTGKRNGLDGRENLGSGSSSGGPDGTQHLTGPGSVNSLLTPVDALPSAGLSPGGPGTPGTPGGINMSEKMALGRPPQAGGVFNEKQPTIPVVMAAGAGVAGAVAGAGVYAANNMPPPTYPAAAAARSSSRSPSSSVGSSDLTPSTTSGSSGSSGPAVGAGSAAATRARSASRSSYSTFPATGRTANNGYGHNASNSSVNSVPRLQPVPAQPFAARRNGSGGRGVGAAGPPVRHVPTSSLPTPPPTAVQPKEAQFEVQAQHTPPLPRLAVDGVAELNGQPVARSHSPMTKTHQPLASPSALAPPPLSSTGRQRQAAENSTHVAHEMDAGTDGDGTSTQNRSSYGSVGGSSITSSVLMSPSMLAWPVPPQTPPISVRDGSSPEDMSGMSRVGVAGAPGAMVPPSMPSAMSGRPLTTSSSGSATLGRGPMPTRAPLNGPSSRNLLQTAAGRRPSLVGGGGGVAPSAYGHTGHVGQQQQKQYPQQYSHHYSHSQQGQQPQFHQQQYPQQQRPPMGYVPPQASALTVHTDPDGQATSVRIPISRYQSPQSPNTAQRRQEYY